MVWKIPENFADPAAHASHHRLAAVPPEAPEFRPREQGKISLQNFSQRLLSPQAFANWELQDWFQAGLNLK